MITKEIATSVRDSFGKGPMRRMRAAGKTPGVVYSGGKDALPLEFETKVLHHELLDLQGRNAVLTLKIDNGEKRNVVIKEIQTDPVNDALYHADFLEIDVNREQQFEVPLTYTGKARGVDRGGIMRIEKTSVVLAGKPLDVPDECAIDVKPLNIGDKVVAGDLPLPEGVKLVSAPDTVCVAVSAP